ncbi:MEDS domain-containing protein [Streptomyces sp. NBC_01190]|uniref:MEDS domain-containing protein n=1 Tax=Streptomyces sp. NBC_01190 TaxID=2903767 RepID=UPI00386CEFC0|nr:MEDS domain-containing protein [Streptomyces sp. NBC_01190]
MRTVRGLATLDPVEVGDHVCWLVGPGEDFSGTARAFTAHGALVGDKVLILGSVGADEPGPEPAVRDVSGRGGADPLFDLGAGTAHEDPRQSLLGRVRREAEAASREGFRALRVLARWDRPSWGDAGPGAAARHELTLDAMVALGGTIVVCAYHRTGFSAATLDTVAGVHPLHLGTGAVGPSFRLFSAGTTDCWSVSGLVDTEGAAAFGTALRELLTQCGTVRLDCEKLEWMDAAGMTALARSARDLPGRRVVLDRANETVRRVWDLLGYDSPLIRVELGP